MADKQLKDEILRYFQANSGVTIATRALVSRFKHPKKNINHCLYELSRRGVLEKIEDAPPVWKLKVNHHGGGGNPRAEAEASSAEAATVCVPYVRPASGQPDFVQSPRDIALSILHRLRLSPQPLAAVVLAKTIACDESAIENVLDQMLRHDIVTNVGFQPVRWILKNDPGTSLPRLDPASPRNSPPPKIQHTGNGHDVTEARARRLAFGSGERDSRPMAFGSDRPNAVSNVRSAVVPNVQTGSKLPSGRPLPPHLLLQQQSQSVSKPPLSAPDATQASHGQGQGQSWQPPSTLSIKTEFGAETSTMAPPMERLQKEPPDSNREIAPMKMEVQELDTQTTSAAKTSIPPSPMSILAASRHSCSDDVIQAQNSFLNALSPQKDDDDVGYEDRGPMVKTPIPSRLLGLGLKDLKNAKLSLNSESFEALNKNPISVLTEFAQAQKLSLDIKVLEQRGPPNKPKFTIAACMSGRIFPRIVATNKKDGRKDAADSALRVLMAEGAFNKTPSPSTDTNNMSRTATHFDKMASLSHQAFSLLAASVPENLSGRKVLAAMVMKMNAEDEGTVIGLGTGNRCITGPEMSLEGHTVNDSHAEVITRRCFIRFLYKHLYTYQPHQDHVLFEQSDSGKIRIKEAVTFHLYISTAPCGDGALFSPRDAADSQISEDDNRIDHEPTFTNNLQGILRTKIEGGEGTIPIESGCHNQTWDGILRGERLRTMSCSDKVCRWNVLGLQGALLANFLEPIYLSSLTLGCLYDHGHLSRAVCCRLEKSPDDLPLPPGYRVNHPHLGRVTSYEPQRGIDKTKSLSLNWCAGDGGVEIVDGTLGQVMNRNRTDVISRIAKKNLFSAFHVMKKRLNSDAPEPEGQSYKEAKENAQTFQEAKKAMVSRFRKSKFGHWVQKPIEEKMFTYQE